MQQNFPPIIAHSSIISVIETTCARTRLGSAAKLSCHLIKLFVHSGGGGWNNNIFRIECKLVGKMSQFSAKSNSKWIEFSRSRPSCNTPHNWAMFLFRPVSLETYLFFPKTSNMRQTCKFGFLVEYIEWHRQQPITISIAGCRCGISYSYPSPSAYLPAALRRRRRLHFIPSAQWPPFQKAVAKAALASWCDWRGTFNWNNLVHITVLELFVESVRWWKSLSDKLARSSTSLQGDKYTIAVAVTILLNLLVRAWMEVVRVDREDWWLRQCQSHNSHPHQNWQETVLIRNLFANASFKCKMCRQFTLVHLKEIGWHNLITFRKWGWCKVRGDWASGKLANNAVGGHDSSGGGAGSSGCKFEMSDNQILG